MFESKLDDVSSLINLYSLDLFMNSMARSSRFDIYYTAKKLGLYNV
jgi:hypothetical protein